MDQIPSEFLKAAALSLGFTTVGVAPALPIPQALAQYRRWIAEGWHAEMGYLADHEALKQDPRSLLPGAKSVIAVTLNYNQTPLDRDPKIARYALGRDYHKVLRTKLRALERHVRASHPDAECRICVDSAPILDRAYANLAGLGWLGKNTMLIDSKRGSWFFIGLLLTTVPFQPDLPAEGGCGTCRKCIDACPTGAIKLLEGRYQVDSRVCISYQTIEKKGELTVDTHGWAFGCDVCQEVCPFNQPRENQPLRAAPTTEPDFLLPLAKAIRPDVSESEWDELTKGSPIRRATYQGWRRNHRIT